MTEPLQGAAEWKQARCGKVTASKVADIMRAGKNGQFLASRANYMATLIAERLTGTPAESFISQAMQWGTDNEPKAREDYELYTGSTVTLVGFIDHPSIPSAGASPDGFVGDDGLVEFKAPNTSTHIETLLGAAIDPDYIKQMQWQMACTGRKWCDWVSYDPRMPVEMQMYIKRVDRDDNLIHEMEIAVTNFLTELQNKVAALQELHGVPEAAE